MVPHEEDKKRFTLLDTTVPVKITEDEKLAERAFEKVKKRARTIKNNTRRASNKQVALLTALNMAGKLIKREDSSSSDNLSSETIERANRINQKIKAIRSN